MQSEKKELKSIAEYQQGSNIERWGIIQEKDKTIAEQKAEIERLTEENEYLDMVAKQALTDYQNTQVQVDELREGKRKLEGLSLRLMNCDLYKQAVKDTAEKFAKVFKQKLFDLGNVVTETDIDEICKEITEGKV